MFVCCGGAAGFDPGGSGGAAAVAGAAAMPLDLPGGPQFPDWPAQTVANAAELLNGSNVLNGAGNVRDALNSLLTRAGTPLLTGAALTDANQTLATSERYVLLPGTLTGAHTLKLTPGANGAGFVLEIGTQAFNYTIDNDGPALGTLYTVVAGTKFAVWVSSDGTDLINPTFVPLGVEPLL